jgi:sulfate transport system ATP-binding protein
MEVADRLTVLRDGRIEQTGTPRSLYEAPANAFVMGFLGPVSRVDGRLVRPHDLTLADQPIDGADEAMVGRVLHLGFEVRVELVLRTGEEVTAQITRAEADELELAAGDIVWVRSPGGREAAEPATA